LIKKIRGGSGIETPLPQITPLGLLHELLQSLDELLVRPLLVASEVQLKLRTGWGESEHLLRDVVRLHLAKQPDLANPDVADQVTEVLPLD